MAPTGNPPRPSGAASRERLLLTLACLLVALLYASFANLKGIGTDEGFRLGLMNGGEPFTTHAAGSNATWADVLHAMAPYAYQPLYFLVQNAVMRVGHTDSELVLKGVNVFFLWVSLQGLLALSTGWRLAPRLFAIGLFSLNAFLLMHVLQVREYVLGVAFYVWSTWWVLRLDTRELGRRGADLAWFAGYGVLLTAGFFAQSWVVFPAVAQGIFLVLRPRAGRVRFLVHLAFSYVVLLAVAYPYLQANRAKVVIGVWGQPDTPLWSRLGGGYYLALTGQEWGQSTLGTVVFVCWTLLVAGALALFFRPPSAATGAVPRTEYHRQVALLLLSLGILTAFQIGYYFKVDTLSVWPRYFAAHYFFLMWLVILAFKYLDDLASLPALSFPLRRGLQAATAAALAVMLIAGGLQAAGYHRYPYFDSGLSAQDNWRVVNASLRRLLQPDDGVLTHDFLHTWTLTFTQPLPQTVIHVPQLEPGALGGVRRCIYLEHAANRAEREAIAARLHTLGFSFSREQALPASAGGSPLANWQVVVFERS